MHTFVNRTSARIGAAAFTVASLTAQAQNACGPGSTFGITSYQCANCSTATLRDSAHVVYTFGAEPVVLEAREGMRVRPGDVVVAVNGNPITTRAGADQFAYPPAPSATLTVRRNGSNVDIEQAATLCVLNYGYTRSLTAPDLRLNLRDSSGLGARIGGGAGGARSGGVGGAAGATGGRGGRGGAGAGAIPRIPIPDSTLSRMLSTSLQCTAAARLAANASSDTSTLRAARSACAADSLRLRTGATIEAARTPTRSDFTVSGIMPMPETQSSMVELRNFGFALSCRPSCTRMRTHDGTAYWRFDGYPSVVFPATNPSAKDGLAAKAGLHEGDVLISVNGLSPLTEEGGVLINRSDRELSLNVEISRAGKREHITLKL